MTDWSLVNKYMESVRREEEARAAMTQVDIDRMNQERLERERVIREEQERKVAAERQALIDEAVAAERKRASVEFERMKSELNEAKSTLNKLKDEHAAALIEARTQAVAEERENIRLEAKKRLEEAQKAAYHDIPMHGRIRGLT